LRQLPGGEHTPILIMTGLDDFESITKAYDAGATDFIVKPLNAMLLTHRIRYMVRANQVLQELRASQATLTQARDAAMEGARLKSEFLATMSHEIRTPMNGVLGMTDWLLETDLTQEQLECAQTIRSSGDSLMVIINDILDFSKIESGKLSLELIDLDLPAFIDRVLTLFAERAQRKGLLLHSHIAEDVPAALCGDPTRLQQVLSNLLANAIKFSPIGGSIILHMHTDRGDVVISVKDDGIGIDTDGLEHIFDEFTSLKRKGTAGEPSFGLGLSISKQIVEEEGGTIWAESSKGNGSTFFIRLPGYR
jgi:signal transduction histidine kinase